MVTRRQFLGAAAVAPALAAQSRPNVLFLSVDDMNDWVGCLRGYPGVSTPNIDRLAKRGVLFANAHCPAPLCSPSRTALFTGLSPATSGIYNNDQYWRPALPDAVTIPQYFMRNGYHVAGAGKIFHHVVGYNPPDQWHEFKLQVFDDPWYRRPEWYPWNKKEPVPPGHPYNGIKDFQRQPPVPAGEFDWGVLPKAEAEYGDEKAVEFAGEFLGRRHAKPFFLAIGLWHPHIPMFAPQKYFDLYPEKRVRLPEGPADDLDDVPLIGRQFAAARRNEHEQILKEGKWRDAVRAYLASVSFADAMVGQVLGMLDRSPYGKNTTIVFYSDNGWHLGEKQHWHKSTLWQRSTHVPFIMAGPGMAAGRARTQPVNLLDIYPTMIELCGLPGRSGLDGQSLGPLLRDPAAKREATVITYLPGNHAVRTERWRYIRYSDGGEELYDCMEDPNEFRNVAGDPQYSALKRELGALMPKTSAPPKPERGAYDFDFATYTFRRKN